MCAALCGVLPVDEAVVFLAILPVGVGEGYFYVFALEVYDGVEGLRGHGVGEQVFESVAREYAVAIEHYGEAGVEVGVVAQ